MVFSEDWISHEESLDLQMKIESSILRQIKQEKAGLLQLLLYLKNNGKSVELQVSQDYVDISIDGVDYITLLPEFEGYLDVGKLTVNVTKCYIEVEGGDWLRYADIDRKVKI